MPYSNFKMREISNNTHWGERIGIAWIFDTKDLSEELFWLAEQLMKAKVEGYLPVSINQDGFYSYDNKGRTKIIIILENRKVNFS